MPSTIAYLDTTVNGHFLEDAEVVVNYDIHPGEPDVGLPFPAIEIVSIESRKGHKLDRLFNALDKKALESLDEQVSDSAFDN